MPLFHFDLVVDRDLTGEDEANAIYDAIDDVTPAVSCGVPLLMCSVDAETLDAAVRPVMDRLRAMSIEVQQIRFEPDAVLA